ncbi:SrfA family protein [Pseudomonas fluvialis]|uniref:SrfA family protein n=1 Tax=Pseudomonas fluvialis TaxID=1793966 RepID=UPI0035B15FD6
MREDNRELGALLRSGKSQSFTALGETGRPVYRAALQLREAIRRKGEHFAEHLAIPQSDELGDQIDWYSKLPGDVVPWGSATEEEKAPARAQLEALKNFLLELGSQYLNADIPGSTGDRMIFGKLLAHVIRFPDENFVYLVNGKPVLTFWGFQHTNADRNLEPLHCLYPSAAASSPAFPSTATPPGLAPAAAHFAESVVPSRPWWRRLWWLLPLLLLPLLLLLLLRACTPDVNLPGWPSLPEQSGFSLPGTELPGSAKGGGLNMDGEPLSSGAEGGPGPGSGLEQSPAEEPPTEEPQAEEADPQTSPQEHPAESEPAEEPAATAEPPAPPQLPSEQPLSIPEEAANGSTEFLNGDWRAGAGIQDRRTGKPLRLEYRFNDGKGEVTVRRPDGVTCSGPVAAAMNDGRLGIDSQGQAACADGSNYDMPQVTCAQGAQSIADCTGSYGNERFPMSMRRAGE